MDAFDEEEWREQRKMTQSQILALILLACLSLRLDLPEQA
jgi:hypothetical protein